MEKTINTERIEQEVRELKTQAALAEKHCKTLIKIGERHVETTMRILNRRGIKVSRTQMYFNNSPLDKTPAYVRALIHIYFENKLEERKAESLKKTVQKAGVLCIIDLFIHGIGISISIQN
jgi:hypothetical protein